MKVLVLKQCFCTDERILHTCFHSRTFGEGHSNHVAAMDYSNIERHIADDLKTTGQQRYNRLYVRNVALLAFPYCVGTSSYDLAGLRTTTSTDHCRKTHCDRLAVR